MTKRVNWRTLNPWHPDHPAHDWYWAAYMLAGQLIVASEDRGAYVAAMWTVDAETGKGNEGTAAALRMLLEQGARVDEGAKQRVRDTREELEEMGRQMLREASAPDRYAPDEYEWPEDED